MAITNPVGVAGAISEIYEKLRPARRRPPSEPEAPGAAQTTQAGAHV